MAVLHNRYILELNSFLENKLFIYFFHQDANECWTEMVRMLQQKLPPKETNGLPQEEKFKSLIDQYFGVTFDVEYKCTEADDEPPTKSKEQYLQLSCFISQDVRYMLSGLKSVS